MVKTPAYLALSRETQKRLPASWGLLTGARKFISTAPTGEGSEVKWRSFGWSQRHRRAPSGRGGDDTKPPPA
ncbi:unnamed protein product [Lota lota]